MVDVDYLLALGAEAPVFVPFWTLRFWTEARSERKLNLHPELKHRAIEQNGYPGAKHFLFNHHTRTIAK